MPEGCISNCLVCGKCGGFSILDSFSVNRSIEPNDGYGIAADIGTTSVVLALLNLSTGEVLSRHSFMNPQRPYGPDVISRITAANNGELEAMRRAIAQGIAVGCDTLLKSLDTAPSEIRGMVISGNTVMTYLLLGFPCKCLGVFPFKPDYQLADTYNYRSVFGKSEIDCPVHIVPWLTAFVGGDITAGLLHVLTKERFMLIDLGTNGEMALYDNGKLTVTATAAGPAFEGSSRGGSASGAMDDLASLIQNGFVDETGLLADNAPALFTQKDIRNLQLAKSAVRSGLEILLETCGLDYTALDTIYLAGGIGQAMNVDSAVTIGLLPSELKSKTHAVGNAALGGAALVLLAPKRMSAVMKKLLTVCNEINLAEHLKFNEYFMKYMYFE